MRQSFRIIQVIFILGIISIGCNSKHPNDTDFKGEINQVDHSGKKHGPWMIYADTVLIARGSYVDGKSDGLWTYWYKNGQMKEEGNYQHGVKNGMWVEWYPDGALMWKGQWEKGERHFAYLGNKTEINFIGHDLPDNILTHDSIYRLRFRIQNIPLNNLFVEVSNGSITREEESDLFILYTSSDTILTMAIGYVPDLEFKDFRNLVSVTDFRIR